MLSTLLGLLFATTTPYSSILASSVILDTPPPLEIRVFQELLPVETKSATTSMSIQGKISYYAEKYEVSSTTMNRVIQCESQASTTIQSKNFYTRDHPEWGVKKGERELSFGIAQFHLPAGNKTEWGEIITKEMALDPDISLSTMAYLFSQGKQAKWSCFS